MAATGVRIDPAAIYDDEALISVLGVSSQSLSRARRAGCLKFTSAGRRILYLGAWVLAWLQLSDAEDGEVRDRA